MIAVLTGIDVIIDPSGSAKVLEFNTDVDLGGAYWPHFRKEALLSYATARSIGTIVVIDKGSQTGYSLMRQAFYDEFKAYFEAAGLTVDRYFVDYDTIDLLDLNLVDDDHTLYFRLAYDVYNPLDNTYASNKMLFRELMISTGHADLMPRFAGLLYGLGYYNDIPDEFCATPPSSSVEYPDLVAKNVIQDISTGISFYKIVSGSSELRDQIMMNNDYVEEFVPTNYDNHTGFFRVWNMVDADNAVTYLGGYLNLNPNEIPAQLDVDAETGLVKKYQYSSFLQTTIGAGNGIGEDTLLKKEDGSYVAIKDVQVGDRIANIYIPGIPDESTGVYKYMEWNIPGDQLPEGTTEMYVDVVDKWQVSVNVVIRLTLVDGSFTDFGIMSQILYWSKDADVIRFVFNGFIKPGDKVLTPTGEFVEVADTELMKGKLMLYVLDVEPADYFLAGNILTHNATTTTTITPSKAL